MSSVSTLIARARTTLIDANARTWSDDELLDALQQGVDKVCALLLDAYVVVADVTLAAGVRQYLPDDGLVLIDAPLNGDLGPVTQQNLGELARTRRDWATATAGQPAFFIYDRRSPKTFMVSPPSDGSATLQLVYGALPPRMGPSDEVPISAWFDTALWAFIVGIALAKNTQRQDLGKSTAFMAIFHADLERWQAAKAGAAPVTDVRGER